jgi:20S proteasome alpha/beta subunit
MTIIAAIRVPGKGAVLACDSRATAGDEILTDSAVKFGLGGAVVYATAGVSRNIQAQIDAHTVDELFEQALNAELSDWTMLAADLSGVHFLHCHGFRTSFPYHGAIGSGSEYALGFMDASGRAQSLADAERIARLAVKCAIKRNAACGGKIRVLRLTK